MPTFLTTSRMDPALAARVEASVRGRRGAARARPRSSGRARRVVSILRVVVVLTVAAGIYNIVVGRRERARALEEARAALLEEASAASSSFSPEDREALARIESLLVRLSRERGGDFVADELKKPGALAATLERPLVYVRGASAALSETAQIGGAAAASTKDALLLCLLEPPASRSEKAVLDEVRVAYTGGANLESRTRNARRLDDLVVGLPFALPPWSEKVRSAADGEAIARLRAARARAPLARAREAARAELLLVAFDEPGDGGGPTELDGERAHPVRVVLVELASSRELLRLRRVVDPSWITPARRPTYASGLDACALAFDLHEEVQKRAPTEPPAPRRSP
ncbi:MAG: hypothetical protein KIS78_05840 [Labilithrix sp.]|nr:hypothetical protein [Labilithrix sp.]